MAAQIKDKVWLNVCGTYGIASAQLYWGRMAALLLRILYYTYPDLLWAFVYVDDFLSGNGTSTLQGTLAFSSCSFLDAPCLGKRPCTE